MHWGIPRPACFAYLFESSFQTDPGVGNSYGKDYTDFRRSKDYHSLKIFINGIYFDLLDSL